MSQKIPCAAALLVLLTCFALGCSSQTAFQVVCDGRINDGLLLTIDLVQVSEEEAQQIRQVGKDWFYSDLRRQLQPRTRTVAVKGGCRETVGLAPRKGYKVLAIIADYQFETTDPTRGHMAFRNKDEWHGKRLELAVHDTYLTVEGR